MPTYTDLDRSGPLAHQVPPPRRAVNWRSVGVGLLGVAGIAALAPYNDLLVANTFLIGGTMPIGLLVFFLLVILLINAPLRRWAPRQALSQSELAVALGMGLVGCAIPAVGFMNYVMGSVVGLWRTGGQDYPTAQLLNSLHLPAWLFPIDSTSSAAAAANRPAIAYYVSRLPEDLSIPWGAWLAPAIGWGAWMICFAGALLCLSLIVRRQWVENERLAFPVASVYTTLLEDPPAGHAVNRLLRSRLFWLPLLAVFMLRAVNGLAAYFSSYVPEIPLGFDLRPIMTQPPLSQAHTFLKAQALYFSVIGITFLLQTRIAFSLWFMYIVFQVVVMIYASTGADFNAGMQQDQMAGALLMLSGLVIWIGRAHWMMVIRRMFFRGHDDDPADPYLPYFLSGWGFVAFTIGMIAFLVLAGSSVAGAILTILALMLLVMMVARIAAETGLYYVQINVPLIRAWNYLGAIGARTTTGSHFWTAFMGAAFAHDTRETLSVYSTHALKVSDELGVAKHRGQGLWMIAALGAALAVSYLVSGASMLTMEYAHDSTLAARSTAMINDYGVDYIPKNMITGPTRDYERGGREENHSRLGHVSIGAGLTALFGMLRFRYGAWPLHPLGVLLMFTFPVGRMWFSIFLGWLAKAATVHYGGAALLRHLRDAAIGMIVGEACAVGFWLIVAVSIAALGGEYHVIYLTP